MIIQMARAAVVEGFRKQGDHPGLLLDRGLEEWPLEGGKKGDAFAQFIERLAKMPAPDIYKHAYRRWQTVTGDPDRFTAWIGRVDGRLFIGTGGTSTIEAAVTLHHTYGMPVIPGSAQKGLAAAFARARDIDQETCETVFGREAPESSDNPDELGVDESDNGAAGYMIFHDAWWVPDQGCNPLVADIGAGHHLEYYAKRGSKPATDFDSPVPNALIAIQGSFRFAVEGEPEWAAWTAALLKDAMSHWSIGAKNAGYIVPEEPPTGA